MMATLFCGILVAFVCTNVYSIKIRAISQKKLVWSSVSAVSFSRNRKHPKVFLEGRVRGDLNLVFSSTLQVQRGVNHIVGHCVKVDSACYFLGVRVRWGVDDP